ncbi:efflux RND transporter permease subunit [Paraburkholderia rhizosphaerae]|uniref:Hydrophobe/amphiphile efflux-1 (HAE1) family protein n=1 Tax=Paraburkholderia rhizosphaerae TaxID=480658 RepID=A0A4R8LW20_9BURK|nr:efflux RND transporter permease subunit [Paraburkholderia rhizosphaerae]TDY50987.1 hydrophobe/amphiphile efflux-1 (HAE1) family protein [Paraburkholderia rhizosphaerae]
MIRFFIDRPIFANVIALLIVLLGGVALFNLPVTQYPPITPPTVQVVAHYPGASAQTVVNRIALPVEQQVNGVEHMLYMQSSATNDGTYTLNITFAIGTDIDRAQVLVQNRVAAATALLPQPVQQLGVTVRKRSTAILQIYTLQSSNPRHGALFLSNYATINLHDELARVPGVGDVTIFGAGQYSIRIWLDPQRLGQQGLTPADVIQAIQSQSRDVSAGQLGAPPVPTGQPYQMTINVDGALTGPTQFDDIVIKGDNTNGGRLVRIRDVGHCELGAASYSQFFDLDGKPAAGIAIYQLPDANALDAGRAVQARMAALAENFPRDITYGLPFDTTRFVSASVKDVYVTLGETGLIVLVVILVFLQNWRATLIPATTVPVTIIGAFGAIYIMGFTINLLTLFAIVLAIGVVVDDAIVVVEAVSHRMEAGLPARQATLDAMRELLGPIAGITLVLVSVFLPAAFLPGLTGQMYRQFALVIAATTLISALNALTLKPVQSVRWLRTRRSGLPSPFSRFFNRLYLPLERSYLRGATFLVRHGWFSIAGASALVLAALFALMHVPTGFIPLEDQGYLLIAAQTADAASLERTRIVMQEIQRRVAAIPGVDHVISIGGVSALDNNASASNAGILYITLKDWSARGKGEDLRSLYLRLNHELSGIPDVRTLCWYHRPFKAWVAAAVFKPKSC